MSDVCTDKVATPQKLISSELVLPVSCAIEPRAAELLALFKQYSLPIPTPPPTLAIARPNVAQTNSTTATIATANKAVAAASAPVAALNAGGVYAAGASSAQAGIQAAALNLPPPNNNDPALRPNGGFCIEQKLPKLDHGITALAFAPNGTLYAAEDSPLDTDVDPLIMRDAYHPSRLIAVYNPANAGSLSPIFTESSRITGLTYYKWCALYQPSGRGWSDPRWGQI